MWMLEYKPRPHSSPDFTNQNTKKSKSLQENPENIIDKFQERIS